MYSFLSQLLRALQRFPVAILCSLVLLAVVSFNNNGAISEDAQLNLTLILLPTFALAVALRVLAEDCGWRGLRLRADVLAALPAAFMLLFAAPTLSMPAHAYYYAAYAVAAIAALMCALFAGGRAPVTFWKYNIALLRSLMLALLCATIFYGGIALALLFIELLFSANIGSTAYTWLVRICYFLIAPAIFLAGVPGRAQLDASASDSKLFRIIGLYVLLPIAAVYLAILYGYGLHILAQWELPRGKLSVPILCYSALGLFVYCLLHNLYTARSNKLAVAFGRAFFFTELPLVVLLVLAIYRRTADYGITEERYYVWLAAFWLLAVSLYMVASRGRSLRPMVASAAVVGVLSVVGPWSAPAMTARSQAARSLECSADSDEDLQRAQPIQSVHVALQNSDDEHAELNVAGHSRITALTCYNAYQQRDSLSDLVLDIERKTLDIYSNGALKKRVDLLPAIAALGILQGTESIDTALAQPQLTVKVDHTTTIVFKKIAFHIVAERAPSAPIQPNDITFYQLQLYVLR